MGFCNSVKGRARTTKPLRCSLNPPIYFMPSIGGSRNTEYRLQRPMSAKEHWSADGTITHINIKTSHRPGKRAESLTLMNIETIKVGTNARNLQHFAGVYGEFGWLKGFSYSALNVLADGTMELDQFTPKITAKEIADFMNKPVRILQREQPNGTYTVSFRGLTTVDAMIDPTIYPDDRIAKISEPKLCYAFLVDTYKDTVVAFRVFTLSNKVYEEIGRACTKMLARGCTTSDVMAGWNYATRFSPDALEKASVYLGRDVSNLKTEHLMIPFA